MKHNIRKSNQRFMWGIVALGMIVIMMVSLFLYLCV